MTQYGSFSLSHLTLKLPTNLKLNPLLSIFLSMWLYSFTNHYMILSTNKLESVSNTTAWLLVLCSTFFIIIIVLESQSNYLSHSNSNYFHEDVAVFKSSIISIKYVFISWKYSSTKGALNYVLPSLLNWDFGIFFSTSMYIVYVRFQK